LLLLLLSARLHSTLSLQRNLQCSHYVLFISIIKRVTKSINRFWMHQMEECMKAQSTCEYVTDINTTNRCTMHTHTNAQTWRHNVSAGEMGRNAWKWPAASR